MEQRGLTSTGLLLFLNARTSRGSHLAAFAGKKVIISKHEMQENPSANKWTTVEDSQEVRAKEKSTDTSTITPLLLLYALPLSIVLPAPAGGLVPTDSNYISLSDFPKDTTKECLGQVRGKYSVGSTECFYIVFNQLCLFQTLQVPLDISIIDIHDKTNVGMQ